MYVYAWISSKEERRKSMELFVIVSYSYIHSCACAYMHACCFPVGHIRTYIVIDDRGSTYIISQKKFSIERAWYVCRPQVPACERVHDRDGVEIRHESVTIFHYSHIRVVFLTILA